MKKVEIISYLEDGPRLVGTVYWSPETGVICDDENLRRSLSFGIAIPPRGDLIYADCGLDFLNALKFRFNGLARAGDPVDVSSGEGEPITSRKGESPLGRRRDRRIK